MRCERSSVRIRSSVDKHFKSFLFWTLISSHCANGNIMGFVRPMYGSSFAIGSFKERRRHTPCPHDLFRGNSLAINDMHQYKSPHERKISGRADIKRSIGHKRNKRTILACTILTWILSKPAEALSSVQSSLVDLTSSYHLSRILFLRLLAVVYIAAFSVAKNQNKGLIGGKNYL